MKELDIQPLERKAGELGIQRRVFVKEIFSVVGLKSYKHFCLPMWFDNTFYKVVFHHNLAHTLVRHIFLDGTVKLSKCILVSDIYFSFNLSPIYLIFIPSPLLSRII